MLETGADKNSGNSQVWVLGNCQARELVNALKRLFPNSASQFQLRTLASPTTYNSSPGDIPRELRDVFDSEYSQLSLRGRSLEEQFEVIGSDQPAPRAIILTLFHEAVPLYRHKRQGYVFYVSNDIKQRNPERLNWLRENFDSIPLEPKSYPARLHKMLVSLRLKFPKAPFLLFKRATHRLAYAPKPYSYLEGWDKWQHEYDHWITQFPWMSVVEMDRIIGGLVREQGLMPHQIFPFVRRPEKKYLFRQLRRRIPRLLAPIALSRDIEHTLPMVWDGVARCVGNWLETGAIEYLPAEYTLSPWVLGKRIWHGQKIDLKILESRTPESWSTVFEMKAFSPNTIDWKQLEEYAMYMPCNEFSLRSMRVLLDLFPMRAAIPFVEAHICHTAALDMETLSKARYLELAQKCLQELHQKGKS